MIRESVVIDISTGTDLDFIKHGDLIEVVGLPCLENGSIRLVNKTSDGHLYIFCNICQKHYLRDDLVMLMRYGEVVLTRIK
jgi:hypothetical protein